MSLNQLRALSVLLRSEGGVVEAEDVAGKLKMKGKSLGGVFSSLSRQRFGGESLVVPWGRGKSGRGLRWKLNEKLVEKSTLKALVNELVGGWER